MAPSSIPDDPHAAVLPILKDVVTSMVVARAKVKEPLLYLALHLKFAAIPRGLGITNAFRLLRCLEPSDNDYAENAYQAYIAMKREDTGEVEEIDVLQMVCAFHFLFRY